MLLNIIRQELEKLDTASDSVKHFQTLHEALIANKDIGVMRESPRNHQWESLIILITLVQ
jgi:hypothetical protein